MATANASAFSSTTTGNQQATAASNFAGAVQGNAAAPGRNHPPVPDAIERRYLRIDNSYLFPDRTLAFIDDGSRIRVRTENREVMHSVVAIAQQRGWQTIEVRGTEVFRQGMWREAELLGLEVRGYEPSESERQQVARAQMRQRPEETQGPAPGSPTPSAAADQPRPTRNGARAPIVGV